jgi:hypothetical protein
MNRIEALLQEMPHIIIDYDDRKLQLNCITDKRTKRSKIFTSDDSWTKKLGHDLKALIIAHVSIKKLPPDPPFGNCRGRTKNL